LTCFLYFRAWRNGLLSPIYVPPELRQVRTLLARGEFLEAIGQLWIGARLGSGSAAATLGYVCLHHPNLTVVGYEGAVRLCRESANRSNGYAQYVVACREYEQGNFDAYARWLSRSARSGFVPAVSDLSRDILIATRDNRWKQLYARRQLRRTLFRGHYPAAITLFRAFVNREFAWGMAILGYIAFPIAVLSGPVLLYFCPFSIGSFSHSWGSRNPIFPLTEPFNSSRDPE
jgi:hypothetical protein